MDGGWVGNREGGSREGTNAAFLKTQVNGTPQTLGGWGLGAGDLGFEIGGVGFGGQALPCRKRKRMINPKTGLFLMSEVTL